MAHRPCNAYFNSIRKMVNIAFVSYPVGDFMDNVSALLVISLSLYLWHYNWNNIKVGAFQSGRVNLQGNICLNSYVFCQNCCHIR